MIFPNQTMRFSPKVCVKEYPRHLYEIMRSENLARWRGLVIVGSDKSVAEAALGLFDRADWQDSLAHLALCPVPISGVRASLAASVARAQGEKLATVTSALNAARGQVAPLDLVFVQYKLADIPTRSRVDRKSVV